MSNIELKQAAMAPRRWIVCCATFEKQHNNDSSAKICPRTTRTIEDSLGSLPGLFIVPGAIPGGLLTEMFFRLGYGLYFKCRFKIAS